MGMFKSIKNIISERVFCVKPPKGVGVRGVSMSFGPALPPLEPPVTSGFIYYYRRGGRGHLKQSYYRHRHHYVV